MHTEEPQPHTRPPHCPRPSWRWVAVAGKPAQPQPGTPGPSPTSPAAQAQGLIWGEAAVHPTLHPTPAHTGSLSLGLSLLSSPVLSGGSVGGNN